MEYGQVAAQLALARILEGDSWGRGTGWSEDARDEM